METPVSSEKYINVILVTHNARMRCFLDEFFTTEMNELRTKNKVSEIRFKNASMLLLTIDPEKEEKEISIELVYEGEVNKRKGNAYFVTNPQNGIQDILFPKMYTSFTAMLRPKQNNQKYKIYIIRHGEAKHNVRILNLEPDTLLTSNGIKQARNIAVEYFNKQHNFVIDYLFTSKLRRTRQTLHELFSEINQYYINIKPKKVIVLPCSHELKYYNGGTGNCDANASKLVAPENMNTCLNIIKFSKKYCNKIGEYEIDWNYYKTFYNNSDLCQNTNMIQLLINYIEIFEKKIGGHYYKKYLKYKYKYLEEKKLLYEK